MIDYDLKTVQSLCRSDSVQWSVHALKRMRERKIKSYEVLNCIYNGEIIEEYPNDRPLPSCLIYGVVNTRNLHTVLSSDRITVYIITAYEPDLTEWESNFKTRKEQL